MPPRFRPSIRVHPAAVGAVVRLPTLAMVTIITSPATTPAGLAMLSEVPVVCPVVAPPR